MEKGGLSRGGTPDKGQSRISTGKTKKVRYARLADEPAEEEDILNDLPY